MRKKKLLTHNISYKSSRIRWSTFIFDVPNSPSGSSLLTRWWLCMRWYEVEPYTSLVASWLSDHCVTYRLKRDVTGEICRFIPAKDSWKLKSTLFKRKNNEQKILNNFEKKITMYALKIFQRNFFYWAQVPYEYASLF